MPTRSRGEVDTVPDEPGAQAQFRTAWSESPPCYVPDPDAGPSRFDRAEGQYTIRMCPPDAGTMDEGTLDADTPMRARSRN